MKKIRRIFQAPIGLLSLAIVKIPLFNKYKLHLLSTWKNIDKRSKIDEILYKYVYYLWIKFDYLKEKDPDKRETLKSICMGGKCGGNWAEYYQSSQHGVTCFEGTIDFNAKVGHMTLQEAEPLYDKVSSILENTDSNYLVIQVGSSSGKEIAYFAKIFPQHEFIGTDIYDEVVEYSSDYHHYPNLSFVKCSAKDIGNIFNIVDIKNNKPVLVFASGSLNYVQPEHLTIFFNSLAKFLNLKIFLHEPGSESKGKPDEIKTSIYRSNFSYTHDYKWYAEESGIETVKCEIIRPYYPYENFPNYKDTVHYSYSGKTK